MKLDSSMIEELRRRLPPEAQETIDEVEAEFMEMDEEDPMEGVMEEGPEDELLEEESPPDELADEDPEADEIDEEEDLEEEDFGVPAFFKKKK